MLEKSPQDPKVRAAASVVAAGGAIAAAKVIRERAEGRRRKPAHAYRLKRGETAREGVTRVARGQLQLTIGLLAGSSSQDDGTDPVHEARKALKRLRALLRVSRGELGRTAYRHENLILRDVGRELSGTRDAQVLLQTLDDLNARFIDGLGEEAWAQLRRSLVAQLEESKEVDPERTTRMLDTLSDARARVESWSLPQDGGMGSLADGFARVYRRGRRAYAAVRSQQSSETLHELRKRAKDLWHAAQLLGPAGNGEMKQLQRTAHRVSDLLGEDHDLTILYEHARQHPELLTTAESELLKAVIAYRQRALEEEALAVASELYREKPGKLLRRMSLA